jgi:mono/diheme cytochrome c family protein
MTRLLLACAAASLYVSTIVAQAERPWRAPASSDARVNPLAARPDTTSGGARLFQQRCTVCHGSDATGTRRGPNLTTGPVQRQSDGALFWKITSGNTRTGMPTFSFLPELQRWQLVNYLRATAQH